MPSLERRVRQLEADGTTTYTVIHIRSMLGAIDEPARIAGAEGAEWRREAGESVETFRHRAAQGPHAPGRNGMVVLREHNEVIYGNP